MATWIITANASKARVYSFNNFKSPLELVQEFEHPEAREKEQNLVTDKPGHYAKQNPMRGSYEGTSAKKLEADQFAREIIKFLEKNNTSKEFSKLAIAASPHFLGQLKSHLNNNLSKLTKLVISKDYTCVTEQELMSILQDEYRKAFYSVNG